MTNKELAQKILNVLKLEINDSEMADAFKKEFNGDFVWYVYYLASEWYNDLQDWCESILEDQTEKDFFCDPDEMFNKVSSSKKK